MPAFETRQGHQLYYELYGEPANPVITMVNGLSMRTSHWAPYFEMLPAAGCRVLSYDLLGQGLSSKPVLGADFDDHTRMLRELHDYLGIDRPYVMGISFGGVVALKYGIAYPDACGGVLPVSTFSELDPQLAGHALNLYTGLSRVGFEYYLDLLMPLNFTNAWLARNTELIGIIKRVGATSNDLYGIQNLMESLADFTSITGELPRIQSPTLILNGEYDYLTPRHLHDILLRRIGNSRLVLVQRVCHAFTLEIPELVSGLIAEFVRDVERGTWKGDQSVWIAAEDPNAEPLLIPCPGDHLRAIPLPRKASGRKPARRAKGAG
ncbi:MAG: alpha/beta hydrolase [Aquisalimonadaceae bacterium]